MKSVQVCAHQRRIRGVWTSICAHVRSWPK